MTTPSVSKPAPCHLRSYVPSLLSALALLVVPALSLGCIDTDAAVFVEGTIQTPSASVQSSALAAGLAGTFGLNFHLGARASDDSQVTLRGVSVRNADGSQTIVETLKVASSVQYPATVVSGGDDLLAAFTFTAEENLLGTSVMDALCQSGGIVISVSFEDSLLGATGVAASDAFTVSGCP